MNFGRLFWKKLMPSKNPIYFVSIPQYYYLSAMNWQNLHWVIVEVEVEVFNKVW